jgi:hypothetical protein
LAGYAMQNAGARSGPGGQLTPGLPAREAPAKVTGPPPRQRPLISLPGPVIMAAIQAAQGQYHHLKQSGATRST